MKLKKWLLNSLILTMLAPTLTILACSSGQKDDNKEDNYLQDLQVNLQYLTGVSNLNENSAVLNLSGRKANALKIQNRKPTISYLNQDFVNTPATGLFWKINEASGIFNGSNFDVFLYNQTNNDFRFLINKQRIFVAEPLSNTISLLFDDKTQESYLLDLNKSNDEQLENLNRSIYQAEAISQTKAIVTIFENFENQIYYFDLTKSNDNYFEALGFGIVRFLENLENNQIFLVTAGAQLFLIDGNQPANEKWKLIGDGTKLAKISEQKIIYNNRNNQTILLDINDLLNPEILSKTMLDFIPLSEGNGIFIEDQTQMMFFFDASKSGENRFINLQQKIDSFIKLSPTSGIITQNFRNFSYFDFANFSQPKIVNLNNNGAVFTRFSDTTGTLVDSSRHLFWFDSNLT